MGKLFSLLYGGALHAGNNKVIPQEEFTTLLDASAILEKAKLEAEQKREESIKEGEELKEEAKKQGYEEGLARLNEEILKFDQNVKSLRHEMNKLILPLALKAAKKIVGKELEIHPETIVDIVMQTLNPVLHSHHITIWVSKADKEILEAQKPKLKEKLEQVESLLIKERADLEVGSCVIETEGGIINASMENQWRALEAAFERHTKHS